MRGRRDGHDGMRQEPELSSEVPLKTFLKYQPREDLVHVNLEAWTFSHV